MRVGRVLIIAGSDSGGGAGIQGDIKTVTCLGGYASSAITALTAQNTKGVFDIHDVPQAFIKQQIELVLSDIGADAIKTGMLSKAGAIRTIADTIKIRAKHISYVLDPVMFAKGGAALLDANALDILKKQLIPLAGIVTPNIPEAEALSGMRIRSVDDMIAVSHKILELGCKAVLLKGGHRKGNTVTDVLVSATMQEIFSSPRIASKHTHGTGCTLASAIATGLAQGMPLEKAVARARAYVIEAIKYAPGLGKGHGPLGHNHTVKKFSC